MSNSVFTVPNLLTALRLALLPFLVRALAVRHTAGYESAVLIGAAMIASDILDGAIARRFGQASKLGWIMDPISDKIIVNTLVIFFVVSGELPYWVAVLLVARDGALGVFALALIKKHLTLKPNIWGRLSTLGWGLALIALTLKQRHIAWCLMLMALALSLFSAGTYYGEYRKVLEER